MRKKLILVLIVSIIIILIYNNLVFAYSESLINFINNGKKVRLCLFEDKNTLSFVPQENILINTILENRIVELKTNKKYKIKIGKSYSENWLIQVIATHDWDKIIDIKKQLQSQGFTNIITEKENQVYRLLLGKYSTKTEAKKVESNLNDKGWETWVKMSKNEDNNNTLLLFNNKGEVLAQSHYLFFEGKIMIDNRFYPGNFEFLYNSDKLTIYNTTEIETIIKGILAQKKNNSGFFSIPESGKLKALKVEAILCRTYLLFQKFNDNQGYLKLNQYQGLTGNLNLINQAQNLTNAQVLESEKGLLKKININNMLQPEVWQMASQGKSFLDIINSIYPGSYLKSWSGVLEEEVKLETMIRWGLQYKEIQQLTWTGPRFITILDLDLNQSDLNLKPVLSQNKVTGFEYLTDIVKRTKAIAAINGGFFSSRGEPLGLLMIDGNIITDPVYQRTMLGISNENEILIDRVKWQGLLNGKIEVTGINQLSVSDAIILYNKYFGKMTPEIKKDYMSIVVKDNKIYSIKKNIFDKINIPDNGFVLLVKESSQNYFKDMQIGDSLTYKNHFLPQWRDKEIISALGAGPKLITEGKIDITSVQERFQDDIVKGRAPRSALGITEDNHLLLVTVDGRQPQFSVGISLEELVVFLKEYDVESAINLDGGNSAQMVIRNFTVNNPVQERFVANGLIITQF